MPVKRVRRLAAAAALVAVLSGCSARPAAGPSQGPATATQQEGGPGGQTSKAGSGAAKLPFLQPWLQPPAQAVPRVDVLGPDPHRDVRGTLRPECVVKWPVGYEIGLQVVLPPGTDPPRVALYGAELFPFDLGTAPGPGPSVSIWKFRAMPPRGRVAVTLDARPAGVDYTATFWFEPRPPVTATLWVGPGPDGPWRLAHPVAVRPAHPLWLRYTFTGPVLPGPILLQGEPGPWDTAYLALGAPPGQLTAAWQRDGSLVVGWPQAPPVVEVTSRGQILDQEGFPIPLPQAVLVAGDPPAVVATDPATGAGEVVATLDRVPATFTLRLDREGRRLLYNRSGSDPHAPQAAVDLATGQPAPGEPFPWPDKTGGPPGPVVMKAQAPDGTWADVHVPDPPLSHPYGAQAAGRGDLVLRRPAGPEVRLPGGLGLDRGPLCGEVQPGLAWSPDSRTLAAVSYREGGIDILLFDRATGQTRTLATRPCGFATALSWSPSGRYLAAGPQVLDAATGQVVLDEVLPGGRCPEVLVLW